jgi:tetratricopeptide (TPR) repeat protein
MGQIADILQARGQLDEALKIRQEDELPVYEWLGDVRSRAVTIGKIADILQARGQLDEALKIRNEEQLPVYERLGDVRSRAVTMGKIADILGQLDEALKIRQEDELPVYERLGDVRALLVGRANLAITLLTRGGEGDRDEARRLLRLVVNEAQRLKLPEAQQIEQMLAQEGLGGDEIASLRSQ